MQGKSVTDRLPRISFVGKRTYSRLTLLVGTVLLSTYSGTVAAGDMDAVGNAFIAALVYAGVVITLSVVAFFLCKVIPNRRFRTLARVLLLVLIYTPIQSIGGNGKSFYMPAFWRYGLELIGLAQGSPRQTGPLSHPYWLAYGIALLICLLVVMVWEWWAAVNAPLRSPLRDTQSEPK